MSAIVEYNIGMGKRERELRVRINEEIHAALKRIAQEEGRAVSELVREAVAEWLRTRGNAEDVDWDPETVRSAVGALRASLVGQQRERYREAEREDD